MEEIVGIHICPDVAGTGCTFQYFLLRDSVCVDDVCYEDYGVMIRSDTGEQAAVSHITPARQKIDALLNLLCQHGVSPIHLRDVIDDWL